MSARVATRKPGSNGGYGNGRPRFAPEERREILAAYDAGEGMSSIARRYGCTPAAVYYHLRSTLRLVPRRDRHAEESALVHQSATIHRCARCGIDTTLPDLCEDCVDVEAGENR